MILVLAFGVVLMTTVALSGLAARSVLSTALVFLVAGALVGPGLLGLIEVSPHGPVVGTLADLALFTVLFVDGGRLSVHRLRNGWRLSGRALGLGMPLTLVLVAVAAHFLVGLDWTTALLVGAILAPTDPVFASAIVSRSEVPARLRTLLGIESGVNDGLALPFVLVLIALATGTDAGLGTIALELVLGVTFGVALPLLVTALLRLPLLGSEPTLQPLGPLAVAITLYGLCSLTHANAYLAAFGAGITLATVAPKPVEAFAEFGELLSELTKFAAVLVFGALLTPAFFGGLGLGEWVVAVLSLVLIRPASMLVSLWRAAASAAPGRRSAAGRSAPRTSPTTAATPARVTTWSGRDRVRVSLGGAAPRLVGDVVARCPNTTRHRCAQWPTGREGCPTSVRHPCCPVDHEGGCPARPRTGSRVRKAHRAGDARAGRSSWTPAVERAWFAVTSAG